MEPLVRARGLFTRIGVNSQVFLYLGDFFEVTMLMTNLDKEIYQYWYEWRNEYQKILSHNRRVLIINSFSKKVSDYLVENSKYLFYALDLRFDDNHSFKLFVEFSEEHEICLKRISLQSILLTPEDKSSYLRFQRIFLKNFHEIE